MPRLQPIHWRKFEKFLFLIGCEFVRQESSHRIYWREGIARPVIVPCDAQLPVFIIRNNLRVLGISPREYLNILQRL